MGTVYPTTKSTATDLLSTLPQKFEAAKTSGELFFFPSTSRDIHSEGRRFNLRSCPALLDKQKAKKEALAAQTQNESSPEAKRPRRDSDGKQNVKEPFKPPYVEELYVGTLEGIEGEEGMSILLNKYSLLPEHMLLCPIAYQPQSLPPTPPQLALAHHILHSASRHPTRPKKLLGFYNGGPGAGASQTWRHFQFIDVGNGAPVEEWIRGLAFEKQDEPKIVPNLPYLHIVHPLPNASNLPFPPTEESNEQVVDVLAPAFMKMLDLAFDALRTGEGKQDGGWNLLITLDHLHLIPRSAPAFPLPSPHEPLELNSLGYAGLMLVRSEDEEKSLLESTEGKGGLLEVLKGCGVPREWGEKAQEAAASLHAGDQYLL